MPFGVPLADPSGGITVRSKLNWLICAARYDCKFIMTVLRIGDAGSLFFVFSADVLQ